MTPSPAARIRYVPLPSKWPGRNRPTGWKPTRSPFKFKAWDRVVRELLEEVAKVNGRDVELAIDVRNPAYWRNDGGLRADARPESSRIIVSFTRPDGRKLVFPCDAYGDWQDNVWAIRLSLEALRSIDRYGVTQGDQQYVGFAALPPGREEMTVERAREIVADLADLEPQALAFPSVFVVAVPRARARAHPDREGGSTARFQELEQAVKLLEVQPVEGAT